MYFLFNIVKKTNLWYHQKEENLNKGGYLWKKKF